MAAAVPKGGSGGCPCFDRAVSYSNASSGFLRCVFRRLRHPKIILGRQAEGIGNTVEKGEDRHDVDSF